MQWSTQEFETTEMIPVDPPIVCPVCWDHAVEPIERVRLSVTINGVTSDVHRVVAFRCPDWHIFMVVQPSDVDGDARAPIASPYASEERAGSHLILSFPSAK